MKKIQIFIACLFAISVNAQTSALSLAKSDSIARINAEIIVLSNEINKLKEDLVLMDKKYTNNEVEIKKYVNENYTDWITSHASFILWIAGILGLIGAGVFIRNLVIGEVKRRVKIYLDNDEWFDALNKKIDKQLDQNKFKQNMKIGVFSKNAEGGKEMLNFFTENEFPNILNYMFTGDNTIDFEILKKDIDVLVLNNQNNQLGFKQIKLKNGAIVTDENTPINDLIEKIRQENSKLSVFYFNDNSIQLPRKLNEGLISSFANSYASIYHNILDLMRYKYKVIDQKD